MAESEPIPAAVWYRISTDQQRQSTDNQVPDVQRFAAHHGCAIVREFTVDDSAWKDGTGGPVYRKTLEAVLQGAWRGEYRVIIVWALDRITRLGAEDALRLVRQFRERGCTLLSVQEPWLNGSPEIVDVLIAFAGWQAQQESARKSGRVKAGLDRRRREGKPVGGRKAGSKDKKPRDPAPYRAAWEKRKASAGTAAA